MAIEYKNRGSSRREAHDSFNYYNHNIHMSDYLYERPLLITLIGILYGLIAIVAIIGGIMIVLGGESILIEAGYGEYSGFAAAAGAVFLVLGLIYLLICIGFFKGWPIMWYLGVFFSVIGAIMCLVSLLTGSYYMVVGVAIYAVILLYLFKDNVKLYFLG